MGTDAVSMGSQSDGMRERGARTIQSALQILASVSADTESKKRRSSRLEQREQPLSGILDDGTLHEKTTEFPWTSLEILAPVSVDTQSKKRRFRDTQSKKRRSRLLQQSEQLLPGIPDCITLHEITTKLPYTAFQVLASVSPRWRQAIRSRQVYDTRVWCRSTEELVLLDDSRDYSLGLYSMKEKSSSSLPRVPFLVSGTPNSVRTVALDGRMYVLGGDSTIEGHDDLWGDVNGTEVFVLDLAGGMVWKRCASMLEPRARFDCGVVDGKIYVFGGSYHGKLVGGSEVYDPKRNVWSSIQPMRNMREGHHVVTVGDELFVKGGSIYEKGKLEVEHTDGCGGLSDCSE